MLDRAFNRPLTATERNLWALNLGRRIVRDGRDAGQLLQSQQTDAVQDYLRGATRGKEEPNQQEETLREV